jgi:membrane-bound serine protease (ClpP class)
MSFQLRGWREAQSPANESHETWQEVVNCRTPMRKSIRRIRHLGIIASTILSAVAVLLSGSHFALAQTTVHVNVATVNGVIDPITAQYVDKEIQHAQQDGAQCLVMQLDTPGGSDGAMRDIVQSILNSSVPVVVYVSPAGARAGSAGVFITLAADIAAMAPGTNIGAAHPVDITGEITGTMNAKVTNDAAAYARALAERRGRNADWAEQAVRQSVSITANEAVKIGVVDLIADNLLDLMAKIDGETVSTASGERILATKEAEIVQVSMSLPQEFLHAIVDPNIAYLLFIVGIIGLVAEFFHPGAIFPGVTGAICMILAFVAFGSLPVNWGGVVLIVLAVVLFILDIKVAGYVLSVGGAIAFILGSLMLFSPLFPVSPSAPTFVISRPLIIITTLAITAFFVFALSAGIRAQRKRVISGMPALVGATGVATSDLDPQGTVQVKSELWSAVVDGAGTIRKGEQVIVVAVEGVKLKVRVER